MRCPICNEEVSSTEQASVVKPEPVAYLDIGAVGYIDLGTDLSTEQLQALPAGRHMLGIIGTFGADGYVPAQQAKPQPLSDERDKRIAELEKKLQEALDHIAEINDIMDSID